MNMNLLDFPASTLLNKELLNATRGLLVTLRYKDIFTQLHSSRVVYLAAQMGQQCGLSSLELDQLKVAACLHDIGKIGIDQSIIAKPGPLDEEERKEVQKHPKIGANIIMAFQAEESQTVAKAIRHHHEDYDGSGYPDCIQGEDIPILSRIIAIVDCFDAMSEHRPYHGKRDREQVLQVMSHKDNEGKFDPYLYRKFKLLLKGKTA